MRKKRRKFELLAVDLKKVLADPCVDDRYGILFGLCLDVLPFVDELCADHEKADLLIDVARTARESRGPGRDCGEERLLRALVYVVQTCCDAFESAGFNAFLMFPSCDGCPEALDVRCRIMRDICAYAMECFTFKKTRDQFAGTRRAFAFEILGSASWVFDFPEAIPLVLASLKHKRGSDVRGAINFLEEYARARESMQIPPEIVDALMSVAESTENQSNMVGALNVLVEAGHISEFEALDRLDDWQDAHDW